MKWSNSEIFISTAIPILTRNLKIKGIDRLLSEHKTRLFFKERDDEKVFNNFFKIMQEIYKRVRDVSVLCLDCTFSCEPKFYLFKTLPYFLGKMNMGVAMVIH